MTEHSNAHLSTFQSQLWLMGKVFPVAQKVKNLPSMQETWVLSLGSEDLLEKGMATHSSILAWRIPWTEELAGYRPWGCNSQGRTEAT